MRPQRISWCRGRCLCFLHCILAAGEQFFHFYDALFLRGDNIVQDGDKSRADTVAQRIFGHTDSASVVGNHFPHEIITDIVGGTSGIHLRKHSVYNGLKFAAVQANILTGICQHLAPA